MGLSQEQWDKLCALEHGVEIKEVDHGLYLGTCWTLYVNGTEVWVDGRSEPEDICLSRDLADFVYAIRRLAETRLPPNAVIMTPTEFNDMVEDYDEKLRELRERAERAEAAAALLRADIDFGA